MGILFYNDKMHHLLLFISKLSSKKTILLNERIMIPKQKVTKALCVCIISAENGSFLIKQIGNDYRL